MTLRERCSRRIYLSTERCLVPPSCLPEEELGPSITIHFQNDRIRIRGRAANERTVIPPSGCEDKRLVLLSTNAAITPATAGRKKAKRRSGGTRRAAVLPFSPSISPRARRGIDKAMNNEKRENRQVYIPRCCRSTCSRYIPLSAE